MHSATLSLGSASQVAGNGASNDGTGSLIAGNTSIHGNLTIRQIGSDNTNFRSQGKMVVGSKSDATNPPGGHMAYFDGSTAGLNSSSGIAISLNSSHPNNDNHYVTFYKNNGAVAGRIEGQTEDDWTANNALKLGSDEHIQAVSFATATLTNTSIKYSSEVAGLAISIADLLSSFIPDSWCCTMLIPVGCIIIPFPGFPMIDWGDIPGALANVGSSTAALIKASTGDIIIDALDLGLAADDLNRMNAILRDEEQKGVAYATGNGDYAEWMPRVNLKEDISARQIVGIKDGAVSLRTDDFDHLMVISTAPAVLGAMPAEEKIQGYEKVAFMGQVPVDVIGPVHSGDFIIPSGDHDGFGIAVDPAEISAGQVNQIVGVAWETETSSFINTVNVAVGLDNTAPAQKFVALNDELSQLRFELNEIRMMVLGEVAQTGEVERGLFKRFFRKGKKGNSRSFGKNESEKNYLAKDQSTAVEEVTPMIKPALSGQEMLLNMSDEDIVRAVEQSRSGETPEAWKNANTKEISRIIEVVVETYRESAERSALNKVEANKEQFHQNFISNTERTLSNFSSTSDILNWSKSQMAELGIDPNELDRLINKCSAQIIQSELSKEKILKHFRDADNTPAHLRTYKPGTQAEARFIAQIQAEIFKTFDEELPEIAAFMTPLKEEVAGVEAKGNSMLQSKSQGTSIGKRNVSNSSGRSLK
jgi:hypothetical protein